MRYLRYLRASKEDKALAKQFKNIRTKKDTVLVIMHDEEQPDFMPHYADGVSTGMVVVVSKNVKDVAICDKISFAVKNSPKVYVKEVKQTVYIVHYNQILYINN